MKKVFAVSAGSYSDYRIEAIFSTKKLAEEFIALVHDSEYNDIEEYELNPPTANLIKRGYSIWLIHMLRDGNTERVERVDLDSYSVGSIGHNIWKRTQAPAYKDKGIPDILTSKVWAKSEQQAIKIVNEYRTQIIAKGKW